MFTVDVKQQYNNNDFRSCYGLCRKVKKSTVRSQKFALRRSRKLTPANILKGTMNLSLNNYYVFFYLVYLELRTRRTVHAHQIRDPATRMIPLSAHHATCCQTELKVQMFPFFNLNSESISARLTKENYFIKSFNPVLNVT